MQAELVWDLKCGTGEGPVWDAPNRRLLFCDIPAGRIHALSLADGAKQSWQLPENVGSFALCASGRLLVALRKQVVFFDLTNSAITEFTKLIDEPPTNRLNDGKVGPDGSFWVGSMDESTPRGPLGHLYRVTADGAITRKSSGYMVSNGLAWSPDGGTMYHSCSTQGRIDAWDYRHGEISNRREFARVTTEEGHPDGAATDSEGCYWSAGVSAGRLNRFTPDGPLAESVPMPISSPTMPCFTPGYLYVTSLRRGDTQATSLDGGLFRLPTSLEGVPVPVFADI